MNDDELRERLHAMPEPTATIDVDAVVADARRRRRPKVVGAGVAVGAACLAFLAPVVVPGLLGPDPVTSTLQEQGVAEQGDSGAEPAAPASDGDAPDAPTLQTSEQPDDVDVAGGPPVGCLALPAAEVAEGLSTSFESAPIDGTATLLLSNDGGETLTVRVGDVGEAIVADGSVVGAASIGADSALDGPLLRLEPGETERIGVAVFSASACDGGALEAGAVAPVVALAVGSTGEEREVVLGDPSAS